jgi:RNA polymerase sigma factor (sigma-70 family)
MASRTSAVLHKAIRSVANADRVELTDRDLLHRFSVHKDQKAFAILVRRHTEMVLGVCRRTLPTWQDAEDACQATFLVLAQKAQRKGWRPSIANWLYTTARKVAHNARVATERRVKRERRGAVPEAVQPVDLMTGRELLAVLDQELDKLPPRYREPLVLCYLEGLSHDEAALRLGLVLGTLKIRLVRGRKRLGDAMLGRGCVLGAGLLALVATSAAEASPPHLIQAVLATVSGTPPAAVAQLAKGVAVNGTVNKAVVVLVAVVGAATLGIGWSSMKLPAAAHLSAQPGLAQALTPEKHPAREDRKPPAENEINVSGQVLDPDGKPVPGATIALANLLREDKVVKDLTKTDKDGRFRCDVPSSGENGYRNLVARSAGFAADWIDLPPGKKPEPEIVFRLSKGEVPVRGRVLTLEGKPVPGAVVHVSRIYAPDGKNGLKQVYETWPGDPDKGAHLLQKHLGYPTSAGLPEKVTVDAEGRFEIIGVGDGRLLMLHITGDSIEHTYVRVAVDPGFDPRAIRPDTSKTDPGRMVNRVGPPLYGPTFDHAAEPCRVITGTVRDQKTGKAMADVVVSGHVTRGWWENSAHTKTDPDGKYRLLGMPNASCEVAFGMAKDSPYLMLQASVAPTEGLAPATCDMQLVRGVIVSGRVTDRETGKPIQGGVSYAPLSGNKEVLDLPAKDIHMTGAMSYRLDTDGRYRFIAPPGLGLILVQVESRFGDQKPYPQVRMQAEHKEKPYVRIDDGLGEAFLTAGNRFSSLMGMHGYQVLDPAVGAEPLAIDFSLEPGKTVAVQVVGPDGKPFQGATIAGLSPTFETAKKLDGPEFTAQAVVAQEKRVVAALHAEKKLAGTAEVSADAKDSPVIQLAPWGAVTGRVVDRDGKPVAGANVRLRYAGHATALLYHDLTNDKPVTTDAEGRFRLDAPFADRKFSVSFSRKGRYLDTGGDFRNSRIAVSETKDLGDVKVATEE